MLNSRKLVLRKETLTELSGRELEAVAGGARTLLDCVDVVGTLRSCIVCPDRTIATCTCPTGATCVCPTI